MFSGLITDQSTGKTYLLNTNHDGTYGRMLTADGTYNINGQNVYLTFNQEHNGTFGCILTGLSEVRSTGVEEKQLQSIPSDSQQTINTAPSNTFNQEHNGTFGCILTGLSEVRSTGVEEKQLQSIPSDSQQTINTAPSNNQTGNNGGLTADEMKEADTNGDGIVSDRERDFYEAMKNFDWDKWLEENPSTGGKLDWNI